MRKLVYELSNGTTVDTMKSAQESGLEYVTTLKDIPEVPSRMSPKQMEMRKKVK